MSGRQKPIVVDNMRNAITDPLEVYSGCYGRAAINFFGYSSNGKKGISAGLLSIQKLHDGEALGGSRGSAKDDFDDGYRDAEADDDFLNVSAGCSSTWRRTAAPILPRPGPSSMRRPQILRSCCWPAPGTTGRCR